MNPIDADAASGGLEAPPSLFTRAPAAGASVVFDLDGTLTLPLLDFDAIRAEIGLPPGPILESIDRLSISMQQRAQQVLHQHERRAASLAQPQPDASNIVEQLRRAHYRVGVLTRNSRSIAEEVLSRLGIQVDAIRARQDGPCKPSPASFFSLCAEFGCKAEQSWMVGDFEFDILCGRRAGARTVLLCNGGFVPDYAAQADFVIHRLIDLTPPINQHATAGVRPTN